MYYFDYGSIDYASLNYRPITLFATAALNINSLANIQTNSKARKRTKISILSNCSVYSTPKEKLFAIISIFSKANIQSKTSERKNTFASVYAKTIIEAESFYRKNIEFNICTNSEANIKAIDKNYITTNITVYSNLNANIFRFLLGKCSLYAECNINSICTKKFFEGMALNTISSVKTDVTTRYQATINLNGGSNISCDFKMKVNAKITQITGKSLLVCDSARTIITGLTDAPATFFTLGNRCYMMNGTEFIWTDGEKAGHVKDIAYVPLFTLGGSKDGAGTVNEPLNYLSDSWWDSYSPDGEATTFPLSFKNLTSEPVIAEEDTATGTVTYTEGNEFTVDREAGTVTFSTPPAKGTNTLRIKATKTGMMDKGLVLNCTQAIIYGGNNDTRVFISGNPDNPNMRLQSGLLDPTYWPEQNFDEIGSDAEAITGFGKIADVLFTYKEKSRYYTYVEGPDDAGFVSFPTLPVNDEYGCIAPRTILPAQDGLIALSKDGVTWSKPSTVRGQFNTKVISRNINGRSGNGVGILDYTEDDLKNAHAIIYDDKYMLHIKDKVWILDLKYTDLEGGVYCWYPWNGIPGKAEVFIEVDGDLYIGGNGVIYKRNDRYLDDGQGITCYWTSPLLFLGYRDWIKKFERLNITFQGQPTGNHKVKFITDQGTEDVLLISETAGTFDYGSINYAEFAYGVQFYPSTQSEKVGYKGEYMQWQIRNEEPDEGLTILSQSLQYSLRKRVK